MTDAMPQLAHRWPAPALRWLKRRKAGNAVTIG